MKTKHTQGEWHACCLSAKPHFVFAGEDKTICSMFCNDKDEEHYESMEGVVTKRECVANAKLISSSPDLLEYCTASWKALKEAQPFLPVDRQEVNAFFLDSMETIIKKATE